MSLLKKFLTLISYSLYRNVSTLKIENFQNFHRKKLILIIVRFCYHNPCKVRNQKLTFSDVFHCILIVLCSILGSTRGWTHFLKIGLKKTFNAIFFDWFNLLLGLIPWLLDSKSRIIYFEFHSWNKNPFILKKGYSFLIVNLIYMDNRQWQWHISA